MYYERNEQFRTNETERRWAHLHHIDIKRLREVHLLVDELRNRLKQLNIHVPKDLDGDLHQRRKNTIFEQQNLLHLKVFLFGFSLKRKQNKKQNSFIN